MSLVRIFGITYSRRCNYSCKAYHRADPRPTAKKSHAFGITFVESDLATPARAVAKTKTGRSFTLLPLLEYPSLQHRAPDMMYSPAGRLQIIPYPAPVAAVHFAGPPLHGSQRDGRHRCCTHIHPRCICGLPVGHRNRRPAVAPLRQYTAVGEQKTNILFH